MLANCDGKVYLPILHLPSVELHCKLQEKLYHVIGPIREWIAADVLCTCLTGLNKESRERGP